MMIGFWPEFTKADQRRIRTHMKGFKAKGLATPNELLEWSKRIIGKALKDLKKENRA